MHLKLHRTKEFRKALTNNRIVIAWSGGVDSTALLHSFCRRPQTIDIHAIHFMHEAGVHDDEALEFVLKNKPSNVTLHTQSRKEERPKGCSPEQFWRNQRISWFKDMSNYLQCPIMTGHTLDDVVETWVHTSMTGTPALIPYAYDTVVIRPLLTSRKIDLINYCKSQCIEWYEDQTNKDTNFATRNKVRHEVVPNVLGHYPHLMNMIRRKIINRDL